MAMINRPQHIYAWLFCGFAALGAFILGYDGVYLWFYYFGTVFSKDIGLEDPFLMAVIVFLI